MIKDRNMRNMTTLLGAQLSSRADKEQKITSDAPDTYHLLKRLQTHTDPERARERVVPAQVCVCVCVCLCLCLCVRKQV